MNKIYVAYHSDFDFMSKPGYIPIHVGSKISSKILPILRDDSAENNISGLNPEFCELTATYWAWKNSSADIVGINHYRRLFSQKSTDYKSKIYQIKRFIKTSLKCTLYTRKFWIEDIYNTDSSNKILDEKMIEKIITHKKKVIVPHRYFLNNSVRTHYDLAIGNDYISVLLKLVLTTNNKEFIQAFENSLSKSYLYPCNMIICNRLFFNEYCGFIFPILIEHYNYYKTRNDKYFRVAGYMGELMTNAFIQYKMKEGLKFEEFKILHLKNN